MRVSDGRRTGAHFERLNVQKLIRAAAGNQVDPIISGREEGRKSQQVTPLDGTWKRQRLEICGRTETAGRSA